MRYRGRGLFGSTQLIGADKRLPTTAGTRRRYCQFKEDGPSIDRWRKSPYLCQCKYTTLLSLVMIFFETTSVTASLPACLRAVVCLSLCPLTRHRRAGTRAETWSKVSFPNERHIRTLIYYSLGSSGSFVGISFYPKNGI